jgi:general secretion pathway protein E
MAEWAEIERVELDRLPDAPIDMNPVSHAFFFTHEICPVEHSPDQVTVACWDVLNSYAEDALRFALRKPVRRLITERSAVLRALRAYRISDSEPQGTDRLDAHREDDEGIDRLRDLASEEPIIRLVQRMFSDGVLCKASDIHIEPTDSGLDVRYRQDGLLRHVESHPRSVAAPVVSRIKVMAGLNIAERRLPQDGRITVTIQGKSIDFRAATAPTLHGETVTLRILDRKNVSLNFDALGFSATTAARLRRSVSRPFGIVLVTGPTGSGKTTTLYAALKEINRTERKVLTIEDPVEYVLDEVSQVHVRPDIGLTFSSALRSFLRLDPDVLMVGEIRDRETAEIAVQAALTGHLLLSTLHTNSAAAAITRLLDMGIDDYLLTSTLDLIIGQRLVRKLCSYCRVPYEPTAELRERFLGRDHTTTWYRSNGCAHCQHTGWAGRTTLIELLPIDDSIRRKILARADAHALQEHAQRNGMTTMLVHGIERVCAGVTSIDEVLRVTNLEQRSEQETG